MSWSSRRAVLVLTSVALLAGLSAVTHLHAQRRPPPKVDDPRQPPVVPPKKPAHDLGNLVLTKNEDLKESLDFVEDSVKRKDWVRACETLQRLVGRGTQPGSQDDWVARERRDANGQLQKVYLSIKQEASRLIGALPEDGLKHYDTAFGPRAKNSFDQAKTNDDFRMMVQTASLYRYTASGQKAVVWLGNYLLNRGEFTEAAKWYRNLIDRAAQRNDLTREKEYPNALLVKASLAFHQAGDKARKDLIFKELERRKAEIRIAGEVVAAADLRKSVDEIETKIIASNTSDVRMVGAGPTRSALQNGRTPFLEPTWRQKTVLSEATAAQVSRAEVALKQRNQPIFSAFQPITATMQQGEKSVHLVLYRSHWGLHAVELGKDGKFVWDSRSEWSNDVILGADAKERSQEKVNAYNSWLSYWLTTRPPLILENSVMGTLSSDGRFVFAVEDFPVPPPAHMVTQPNNRFGGMPTYNWDKETQAAIAQNKLFIYDLHKQGKVVWELGGTEKEATLNNSEIFFLGPPLSIGGLAYVLAEQKQELFLLALDPEKRQIVKKQQLATIRNARLSQDPMRRVQACHMAYADGVLVIPTNAGAVFGVDLFSDALLWAYPYAGDKQEATPPAWGGYGQPPAGWIVVGGQLVKVNTDFNWMVTPPAILDGKVVFTSPDGEDIHCVNIADGSRVWSAPRGQDDVYLGGVYKTNGEGRRGTVVVVGRSRTRGLSLERGTVAWEVETGLPSGIGAATLAEDGGDVLYYVPIREAVNTKEPEVCAINVDRGFIHAHTRSRSKVVPGNLIFFEGQVLSQTATEIVSFPRLEAKLAELAKVLKDKPNNPEALVERGDYLLDKGDLAGAIADFRKALRSTEKADDVTLAKARTKLYEAYTEHFQRDFGKAEAFLKDYEAVCTVPTQGLSGSDLSAAQAETRRRRANFLCLVGKGREAQNRLVEAFENYLKLGEEARPDELIQVVDEPSVKAAPDVWAQGRISTLVRNATDQGQKRDLEKRIVAKWDKLKGTASPPIGDLRKFVALFGSLFGVGKEARLALAERLMDDLDVNSLLEAEQQLSLLRAEPEPEVAARAVEALARLNTKKGMLEDAAFYYRQLGQKFPKVVVDGKKGEEYLDDLATDKRFLPYLDQSARYSIRNKVELKYDEKNQYFSAGQMHYQFSHAGDALPFYNRYKLSLQMDYYAQKLKLWESNIAEPRWVLDLTRTQFQQIASGSYTSPSPFGGMQTTQLPNRVKFSYQASGHLMVLQLGHMIFGIDPLNKGRVLWEKNLSTSTGATSSPSYTSLEYDAKDNSVRVLYADGWTQRLGGPGPMQAGVVCLQTRDSLSAIDPVTGRTLWARSDVGSRSHLFGDDQHIYVVGMSDNNTPNGTRVFRAYDGVSVRVPDFSDAYKHRVRVSGKNVLASDLNARGEVTLRMYDVLAGKDVWRETFPVGSKVANSEDPRLAAVISPTAEVRVIDVETRKDVLKTKLEEKEHFNNVKDAYLLSDPDYVYLAFDKPDVKGNIMQNTLYPNFYYNSGLRAVPVNGHVYSWKRQNGELQWFNEVQDQFLVLSQFEDLPMVLFTSRFQRRPQPGMWQTWQQFGVKAFAKHNGKMWYTFDSPDGQNLSSSFHTLTMDHRTGTVEFTGENKKVTFTAVPK